MDRLSLGRLSRKAFYILLATGLVSTSLPAWARWGDDDNDFLRQQDNYRNTNQNNYQPSFKPPDIKVEAPKIEVKPVEIKQQDFYKVPEGRLTDDDRQLMRAGNALNPPKVPDSYLNPAKNPALSAQFKPNTTPLTLQFKSADVKTANAQEIKPTVLKDPSATTVKQPQVSGVQKVIQTIGNAIGAVGAKTVPAIQAVAHFFRGNPSTEPSALAKQVSQQYTHLNEIKPGVFQTTNEGQTYANGHSWEPGSTFKVSPNGLQVIHGTAMEDSFGSLSRTDGKTIPVIMKGNAIGGVEPVGVDFARMTPGTSLKATSPVEIPKVGTIQADQITYSGLKNGDPILEVHGKGALSVESISDPKIIKQATDQLSVRLRLMNDSFQVKDAVLTVGGERSYLDAQGKATPVSAIEKGVQAATDGATPMLAGAKKLATADENNGRAAAALMATILNQTGHKNQGTLTPTDEAARFKAAAEDFGRKANAAKDSLAAENYGEVLESIPGLKAQGEALQAEQGRLAAKSAALGSFSKSLCNLSNDMKDGSTKKGDLGKHADQALKALDALAATGQVDPKTARTWSQALQGIKAQQKETPAEAAARKEFPGGVFKAEEKAAAITATAGDRKAYLKGVQVFEKNTVDGKKYDNVLYVKDDDGSFYKVYRQMGGGGLLTAEKAEKISEDSYNKATSGKETRTFCNYAVRSVADKFGVSETFAKPEECANVMCQKLAAGKYDTKDYRFRAVKWKEAERYASDGGFVVGAWDGSKDSTYGHVFVVTGGYDGEVAVNRLYVFHADAIKLNGMHNFGETHLGLALPHNQIKSVNYYVWESR